MMTTTLRGEFDGAVLDNGTVIHWPVHLTHRFSPIVARGDRVKVSGRIESGPAGDKHLEVQAATNLKTGASFGNDNDTPIVGLERGRTDISAQPAVPPDIERRLQALEDQIAELRAEIAKLRDEL